MEGVIMNSERFDSLARSLGTRRDRRSVVKSFGAVALGAAGMIALRSSGTAAPAGKVNICHVTGNGTYNYISVSSNALPAHIAHGDVVTNLDDLENCRACGNVCTAPANGSALCGDDGCVYTCNEGYEPDGNGGCVMPSTGCANALLSGPDGGIFCVDDGLSVLVNGSLRHQHTGWAICYGSGVLIGPVANGDQIQVVANNSPEACGEVSITPFYLSCPGTSGEQALDPDGYGTTEDPGCGAVFYDRTFTAAL
jgi:hypothetical protein